VGLFTLNLPATVLHFPAMKKLLALVAVASIAVCAFAQSPVGAWKGKILMDMTKMPKAANAAQQKQMNDAMAKVKAITLNLNMKANKTFTISIPAMMGQPGHTAEGTWVQSGKKITLTSTKEDGKVPKKKEPQVLTIEGNGRKMSMVPPTGGGMDVKIVFSK
jgi:hypothetical protein